MLDQDSILSWVVLALVVVFVAISFSLASVRRRRADGLHTAWATGDALPPSTAVRAPLQAADEAPPTATAGSPAGSGVSWHDGTEWRERRFFTSPDRNGPLTGREVGNVYPGRWWLLTVSSSF